MLPGLWTGIVLALYFSFQVEIFNSRMLLLKEFTAKYYSTTGGK